MKPANCLSLFILLLSAIVANAQDPFFDRTYTQDNDANFSYTIFTDDHSLIVGLKVKDPAEALKLARNGVEIWIDPRGKKNKKIGVRYPLPASADPQQRSPGGGMDWNAGDTGVTALRKQAAITLARKKDVEYLGFKPEFNGKKDISDSGSIDIATAYPARDALYYSVRIPFTVFQEPIDPSHPFSVGIIIKGMQMPGGGPGGPPGDDGGGGGGFGGGPPPGAGGGGPDGDDFRRMFSDDAVWQKISASSGHR